jgi:AraC-like DNA-binding protein
MLLRRLFMLVRPKIRAGRMESMAAKDFWTSADPLGEALHSLRMEGTFYCRSEFSAPWGLTLPAIADCLWFHVPTSGPCRLEVDDGEPRLLQPGDLALVPHGTGHCLRSAAGTYAPSIHDLPRETVSDRYEILRHGGGGAPTGMVCGAVFFDHPAARSLVHVLPRVIHIEASAAPESDRIRSLLPLIAAEVQEMRPGGETVITRLADILVIQAIRAWISTDPAAQTGWLGALQDPQIGQALSRIHRDPARAWTVAAHAGASAKSRSSFAARVNQLVGEPVMHYLARWRMHVALRLLRDEGATVGDLAARMGYRSEAAFSRAFKRITGVTPGAVRRTDNGVKGQTA